MSDVSIKEVAKIAGVSIATVSRCINEPKRVKEKTRIKVQEAIVKTGYAPNTLAQSFRRGKTNMIMVVLPTIGDPFFTDVMRGIRSVAKAKGYTIMINETQFNTMTADEIGAMMVSKQADGIILLASMSPFGTEVMSTHSQQALPIVIGCETVSSELATFPSVHIDNVAAAEEATNYLLSLGHKTIAFMSGEESSLLTKDREFGYRAAMKEAGMDVDESLIVSGSLSLAGAQTATRELVNRPERPTAIFCANDEMAIGTIHALKAAGLRVPEDISVMGFDDTRYAEVSDPPLTTVSQPAEEIGERVFYRVCKRIEEGNVGPGEPQIVPHKLIIRRSVSAPR